MRRDSRLKRFYSRAFYSVFSYLTETTQDAEIANFGIYRKKVIEAVLDMDDNIRYFPAMVQWVGFKTTRVDVEHSSRAQGESTYNLRKLLRLAVNNIISFSDKPLRLVARGGLILSAISFVIGLLYLVGYLLGVVKVAGYASLIISIWLTAGINIFVLGLVGIYVGKAFEKSREDRYTLLMRPLIMLEPIELPAWDSRFFHRRVGKLSLNTATSLNELLQSAYQKKYELLYIYSHIQIEERLITLFTGSRRESGSGSPTAQLTLFRPPLVMGFQGKTAVRLISIEFAMI